MGKAYSGWIKREGRKGLLAVEKDEGLGGSGDSDRPFKKIQIVEGELPKGGRNSP